MNTIKTLALQAIDTILPPRCIITGEIVDRQGMITPEAWGQIDFITAPQCQCCGFPFEFEVEDGAQCVACIENPPPFKSARSALKYNDASRDMILGFKHADKTYAVKAFIPWLEQAGAEMLRGGDIIMPVPLHRSRLLLRRYNQAAIIAQSLAKATDIPAMVDTLQRTRATPSQGYLKAAERHQNVRAAFAVNPKHAQSVKGKTIILIDDVYTTSATAKECTKALLKADAKAVHILTLARVVKGDY